MVDVSNYPFFVLPAGTLLFHGSDCDGDFLIPDGPAWFAFTKPKAAEWAGWSESVPPGRSKGDKRVLALKSIADVKLIDTRKLQTWQKLCVDLCGDAEAGTGTVAYRAREASLVGWYGRTEVLLTDPAAWLIHQATYDLASHAPGRLVP